MRLYLKADNKYNIGYTPDWLKVSYEKDGEDFELTLDIQGEISYEKDCLNCSCKADLVPWVLYNYTSGDEIDLTELEEEEVSEMLPFQEITEILKTGRDFRVGVFPVNANDEILKKADLDIFSNAEGIYEFYDGENECEITFTFETEFNG